MSKSDQTYRLEETIALATWRRGQIGCPEVGLFDEGIVDYITMDISGSQEISCYELKITKSDFKSSAKKTFIGDYNYYVIPKSLWNSVRSLMQPGIGCWCVDNRGQATLEIEAEKQECKMERRIVARKILYALRREHGKIEKEEWGNRFARGQRLSVQTMHECMSVVMEKASTERSRYGCSNLRLPGQSGRTEFVTVDLAGRAKGHIRCYSFLDGSREPDPVADGLCGDFNFYVCPLSVWGKVREQVPKWIGIWCIDDYGRALRKKSAKHVEPSVSRGATIAAIAQGLDRERMMAVEKQWRRRQYAIPVVDAGFAAIQAGDSVTYDRGTWTVIRIDYKRDGTILIPSLVIESDVPGMVTDVPPSRVRRINDV